jgi:hypothetical protein
MGRSSVRQCDLRLQSRPKIPCSRIGELQGQRRARRLPWSGQPARARPRAPCRWCTASTTCKQGAGAGGRARRARPDPGFAGARRSPWCCRSRSCSPARVFENIRYHKASMRRSRRRDRRCHGRGRARLHPGALPGGYDAMLEERGGNLSLGQRQLHQLRARAGGRRQDPGARRGDGQYRFSYTEMLIQKALGASCWRDGRAW